MRSTKIINSISSSIFIQCIPGHSDIPGNELAKEATTIATNAILPVSLSSYLQVINEKISPLNHVWIAQIYQHYKISRDLQQAMNWQYDVLLARLLSSQHLSLHRYLYRLNPAKYPLGLSCYLNIQDLKHWLCDCVAVDAIRQRVFGCHKGSLNWFGLEMWWYTHGRLWSILTLNQGNQVST